MSNTTKCDDNESLVLVSGYTSPMGHTSGRGVGIYTFNLSSDGILSPINSPPNHIIPTSVCGANPSWITVDPSNTNSNDTFAIYACDESPDITADINRFDLKRTNGNATRNMSVANKLSVLGSGPCHMSIYDNNGTNIPKFLYFANYVDCSFGIYVINSDNANNNDALSSKYPIVFKKYKQGGSGVNKERQLNAHAHCIAPHPNNPFEFYIANLGCDFVQHYSFRKNNNNYNDLRNCNDVKHSEYSLYLESEIACGPGSGPRSLCFHPKNSKILYVSEELSNNVSLFYLNDENNKLLTTAQTVSSLPKLSEMKDEFERRKLEENGSALSHIMIDPLYGKYLYVGVRFWDKIVKFEIDVTNSKYLLKNPVWFDCAGSIPRHFSIDPTNKYLVVGNQEGIYPNIAVFRINYQNCGNLEFVSSIGNVGSPACIQFIPKRNQSTHIPSKL